MRAKSLTRPVLGLYAVRVLLGAAVFIVLLASLLSLERQSNRTHSSANTLLEALDVERSVSEASAGLRGYLLTGQRAMLAPFQDARAALPGELAALVSDATASGQRAPAVALAGSVESEIVRYGVPLTAPGASLQRAQIRRIVVAGGQAAAVVQRRFDVFISRLTSLRTHDHAIVTSTVHRAIVVAAVGLGLLLALELGVLVFLVRGILRPIRAVARAAARLAGGELGARVPETGLGEVAMLAESFNGMAASNQARTAELAAAQERLSLAVAVAEEASAMKSAFLANVSHEVRTPLHGLLGMLALFDESSLDGVQREYLRVARSSGEALMDVVGDVLDIARIEAGRLEIEHAPFDLRESVERACGLMAGLARERELALLTDVAAEVPRVVIGDRTRVAQVLQNLVSNAVKFTPAGEVRVEVSLVSLEAGRAVVRFSVCDTGIGIDPERLDRLFEPFVQAEPGTTRKFGGSGLGLAIARQLAELMGGSVSAESTPGQGSRFSFELPLMVATEVAAIHDGRDAAFSALGAAAPPVAPGAPPRGRSARILVAEDHDTGWLVLERMLSARGHFTERAADGEEVLEMVIPGRYDLLLLDCQMPLRDGFETARELRRRELAGGGLGADGARLPIVAVTAGSADGGSDAGGDPGFDDWLGKPVSFAELDEVLARWLAPPEVLDPDRIEALRELFPGNQLEPILSEMRVDVEQDLLELEVAVADRDQARVAAAAHRIRNTGRLLGSARLAEIAAALDNPPRADREPAVPDAEAVSRLREQWRVTQAALEELTAGAPRSFT